MFRLLKLVYFVNLNFNKSEIASYWGEFQVNKCLGC